MSYLNPPPNPAGLSHREIQITRLRADGISYDDIAAQLGIGFASVAEYVRRAKAKTRRTHE
jgi:DNA-binding CsgD family transcriptional regulator